ncbi:MAG TPA: zinc-dependent metalloprotease [Mycobacteriales bacterium]|nr:zinc-dependent metalloprotease [Mycobacteriales bacterium]
MTDVPFGFGFGPNRDDSGSGSSGSGSGSGDLPFGAGFGLPGAGGIPDDLAGKAPLFAALQQMLSAQSGPVNWELAKQMAVSALATGHRSPSPVERSQIAEAIRLADHWLDPVTQLPSGVTAIESWSRVEWVEKTLPAWAQLCDPVASRVVGAMGSIVPEEAAAEAGPLLGMVGQMGGLMFGAQVGQALAKLAGEVLASTDVGLPLGPAGVAALLPDNVAAFGQGLELPADEVRLFLALREAAYHRLFKHVPWLRQRLFDAVDAYARGITVDREAIERAMSEIDPQDPESMQKALEGGMFEPSVTPEQQTALARLETLLALVEGWVDDVVGAAAADRLPKAEALRETLRRRRATGGPAEQTFATLVGLELRPRRLREAATLWRTLREQEGPEGRDELWRHPDLLPAADDLDDPEGFVRRSGETDDLDPNQA